MTMPAARLPSLMIGARRFGPGYIQRGVGPPRASVSLSHRVGKKHIMNPQIAANSPINSIPRRIHIEPFDRQKTRQAASLQKVVLRSLAAFQCRLHAAVLAAVGEVEIG